MTSSSSTVTWPSVLQSPRHGLPGLGVTSAVAVGVPGAVGVRPAVPVMAAVGVLVTSVAVTVAEGIGV